MDVTVVIGTFGDDSWKALARSRAIPSAQALGVPGFHAHARTLHEARNLGLEHVTSEWVCFLDADDELSPGYFDEMEKGTADVRAPSVSYVQGRHARPARMPNVAGHTHDCTADCLALGNWIIIGALVRTEMMRAIGGFDDHPWSEDWCAWSRAWQAGAVFEAVPNAVYRAHVRVNSRNRAPDRAVKLAAHRAIATELGFPVP